jgi:hypothetical protein
MARVYDVSESAVLPVTPEVAYDTVVEAPLEEVLGERSGPIPGIRECRGQGGPWGNLGQTRTVVLADGGTLLETLVLVQRPSGGSGDYRYQLTDVRGPMKALVRTVDGRFAFEPEGSGTRVTWSWAMHPTNPVTRLVLPVFAIFWRRAALKMFDKLGSRLPT